MTAGMFEQQSGVVLDRRGVRPALCLLPVLIGLAVLAGWHFDIAVLRSIMPGWSTMKVNTAIGFVLCGSGLALAARPFGIGRHVAALLGLALLCLGAATLVEYAFRVDFGIDQFFYPDLGTLRGSGHPGRMSPLTASAFVALGTGLLLLARSRSGTVIIIAHFLAGYAGVIAFIAAASYAFGAEAFWGLGAYTEMAIHTALALLLAAGAALMTRAEEGWLRDFVGSPAAWALVSRLLPVAAVLPVGLGLLIMLGAGFGIYNAAFGFALFAPLVTLALVWVAIRTGIAVRDGERIARQRQEQLDAFISQSTAGFAQVDLHGFFTLVNERFCQIAGRSREELLTLRMQDITHPDDLPRNIPLFERAVRDGTPYSHEKRYVRPDESVIWVNNSVTVIRKPSGEPDGVLAVSLDVTERRRAEATMRRHEQSVRLAAEGAGMATWELDPETLEGQWSANRFDILGYPRNEALRGTFHDWLARVHPDDVERARKAVEDCLYRGIAFEMEYRILRADTGGERWLQSHGSRLEGTADDPPRFAGISFDVTARKQAEAALRDSEWRFRTIFEQANDYIFTSDLQQRVTSCNPSVCTALGYTPEEAVGMSFAQFVGPSEYEQTTAMLQHKLLHGGTTRHTITVHTRDGRSLVWEVSSRLMLGEDGQPEGLHAIARDVTEARRHEEHQRLLIDELNHRVKNTLAIVQAMAQQSFKGSEVSASARETFTGRLHALSTAHGLLTRENWTATSLTQIVRDALAPHGGADGRFAIEGPDIPIMPKMAITVALALHELATNALKYGALSDPAGRVSIRWTVHHREDDVPRLTLKWIESGGPPVSEPLQRGFGTRMIERGLAAEFGGSVAILFDPAGLQCIVEAPLPEVRA